MSDFQFSADAQQWVNAILIWVGFGLVAGMTAKALVPGREPIGVLGTLLVGVLGSVLGPLGLSFLISAGQFNPISPVGFAAAVGGAVLLLAAYRILGSLAVRHEGSSEREPF